MTQIAYITIGASSSGKSTYATKAVKQSQGKLVNVNRDDTRKSLFQISGWSNYNFSKAKEALVTSTCRGEIKAAFDHGYHVIVSDTNLNEHFRNALEDELKEIGFVVTRIWFNTDPDVLRKRNEQRGSWKVGLQVLESMIEKFDTQFKNRDIKDLVISHTTKDEPKQYVPDESLPKAVIFDVDGTLAEKNDRHPFDMSLVSEDTVRINVVRYARLLKENGYKVLIVSGRDGVCKEDTYNWCVDNAIPIDGHFQREQGDQRADDIIKEEIFWRDIAPNYNVTHTVDDRNKVVDMWRRIGLECWQVQEGSF